MAELAVSVKLPRDLDAWVRSRPNRADWLRSAIRDAYEREVNKKINTDTTD